MLWVRLPNLPLEFWVDEILSFILAPAGSFVCSDSSTKLKNRGGYARACVRVDLRRPLRPGVRVRGSRAPFWQQYQYEHLEGVCHRCGSLHLAGSCGSAPEAESSSVGSKFGPWMVALRQRRSAQSPVPELRRKVSGGQATMKSPVSVDGWSEPVKVARRGSKQSCPTAVASVSSSVQSDGGIASGNSKEGSVPVNRERAGFNVANDSLPESETLSASSAGLCNLKSGSTGDQEKLISPLNLENPFALLGSDKWAGQPIVSKDAQSGPSKRARASETEYHRVNPKNDKRKGKINVPGIKRG